MEALDKKTGHMNAVVKMDPPDLKGLQLLFEGSISTQVNRGVQEYSGNNVLFSLAQEIH